jgi:HAD superfamily hydrolase (TIGR01509 family)
MIKGIFFDAAGILYQRMSPTADFAEKLIKQKKYSAVLSEQERQDLETMRVYASQGQTSHEEYWQQFLLLHGVKNPEQQREMIKQITDYSNDVLPVPGCREALAVLKQRNFILGIITDTIYPLEWKNLRLAKAGVFTFIDVIACSSDLGVHKPDPAIYLNALMKVHLTPPESAFVGHSAIEISGAHQAGMMTVAVNYEPRVQADYYCLSMLALLKIPEFLVSG